MSQGSFTDVYALAGTFYYAASGVMIPAAPDRVMGAEYESLEKLVPQCGRQVSEAVDRALLLDARFRTQTMREFVEGITQGSLPAHLASAAASPAAWLLVEKGAGAGQRFSVAAGRTVTVGRSGAKSEIRLAGHPEISGLHFKLLYAREKHCFYVIDQSVNGLYYRGVRLEKGKKYKVMPEDRLGVGGMNCVIALEEA